MEILQKFQSKILHNIYNGQQMSYITINTKIY